MAVMMMMKKCFGSAAVWQKNCILAASKSENSNALLHYSADWSSQYQPFHQQGKRTKKLALQQLGYNIIEYMSEIPLLLHCIVMVMVYRCFLGLQTRGHGSLKDASFHTNKSVKRLNHCNMQYSAKCCDLQRKGMERPIWKRLQSQLYRLQLCLAFQIDKTATRTRVWKVSQKMKAHFKIMTDSEKWEWTSKSWLIQKSESKLKDHDPFRHLLI